jgi:hypothetical protein
MLGALNVSLRLVGAQDYETYSLYLGYCRIGETAAAERLLRHYVTQERRDTTPVAPEIAEELARLALMPVRPDEASALPECVEATDATST